MQDQMDKAALRAPPQPIHQPSPRRPGTFSLTPISTSSEELSRSHTPSPNENGASDKLSPASVPSDTQPQPSPSSTMPDGTSDERASSSTTSGLTQKTRSIVNLTSSTLFGIYSPSGYDTNREEPSTPFGTGAQTPYKSSTSDLSTGRLPPTASAASLERAREKRFSEQSQIRRVRSVSGSQHHQPRSQVRAVAGLAWRVGVLFCVGLAYGEFVTRLHDTREVAPVQVEAIDRRSWTYVLFWGIVAVAVGTLLPWVDGQWGSAGSPEPESTGAYKTEKRYESPERRASEGDVVNNSLGADWNPIVRTIGAFVGIAFAIVSPSCASLSTDLLTCHSAACRGSRPCRSH